MPFPDDTIKIDTSVVYQAFGIVLNYDIAIVSLSPAPEVEGNLTRSLLITNKLTAIVPALNIT